MSFLIDFNFTNKNESPENILNCALEEETSGCLGRWRDVPRSDGITGSARKTSGRCQREVLGAGNSTARLEHHKIVRCHF